MRSLVQPTRAPAPLVVPPPPPPASKGGGGFSRFFRGSPKKPQRQAPPPPTRIPSPPPPMKLPENLARYLSQDGSLGRAFVCFKDIAKHCDMRLFETSIRLIGQKLESPGQAPRNLQVGEVILQIFRLPPLPGIPNDKLPQSLDECHRGLRHMNWHKVTYFEGTLTQSGGDCTVS